ncbi:NACHT domain-containing protein [Bradyrhizobium brasilense]|uniref:NACHT domain-containing protein n=1 Tax=Bradyrhizobium brasilense TaxID=1419277 RepID=UPI0024B0D035|nr:NACHT domain-containing protein [Bradyrhizobium australafricanum]WFU31459.1 NACHT domain-containing protein [Bradyrhizobium australafricanum]
MTQPLDAPGILMDIGITNVQSIQKPPHLVRCELWLGEDDSYVSHSQSVRTLILHSQFAEEHVAQARQKLISLGSAAPHLVLFEDSTPAFALISRVQSTFPEARVMTVGARLRQSIFRGQKPGDPSPINFYVPPTITTASGETPKGGAIFTLLRWMRGGIGGNAAPSRVGVLLAPAGTGKTALARELFNDFLQNKPEDPRTLRTTEPPYPLLIDRFAWINHEFRDASDNLADLVGHAIYKQSGFQPSIERIQRCLRYGAICPILDGFDELCATRPADFNADDTIAGLITALEGVEGSRILLTCRESFWHDNVDVRLQSQVTAFRLSPFSEDQRDEYLSKRFHQPETRSSKDKTISLLQKIASIRRAPTRGQGDELHNLSFLPWVVQFAAEAISDAVMSRSAFDSMGAPPEADPLGHVLWQFCRREQQRIGISMSSEGQIRFFSTLAALCDEFFSIDQVDSIHELLSEQPDYPNRKEHVEFLRKHGFLRIVGNETPYNCRFEYPEVQDYLRARLAVESIGGAPVAIGDDDVFRKCAVEQTRLVDFISLLLRWRMSSEEILLALSKQRERYVGITGRDVQPERAGLVQILFRVLRDTSLAAGQITREICVYFGDPSGRYVRDAFFSGLISRLDLRGISITNSRFKDVHLEHCTFDAATRFDNCVFEGEFGATSSNRHLGDVVVENCTLSEAAQATFRQHKNQVGRIPIDRSHIEDACHYTLKPFHIGQMRFRDRNYDDIRNQAAKASLVGHDLLDELIRTGVLEERKFGNRHRLQVADKAAVASFIQQSTPTGPVGQAINRIAASHIKSKRQGGT